MKKNIINFLKEVARLVACALPGIGIQLVSNDPKLAALYGGLLLAILRAADKAVHDNPDTPSNGFIPF